MLFQILSMVNDCFYEAIVGWIQQETYEEEIPDESSDYATSYMVSVTDRVEKNMTNSKQKYDQPYAKEKQKHLSRTKEVWEAIVNGVESLNLSKENGQVLLNMLLNYQDVFRMDYQDLMQTNLIECQVDTGDATPIIYQPNRYMSFSEQAQLKKEVAGIVKQGQLILASQAQGRGGWTFPALYVKKNNGTKRLRVQFQKLNEVIKKEAWPTSSITDLIEDIGEKKAI